MQIEYSRSTPVLFRSTLEKSSPEPLEIGSIGGTRLPRRILPMTASYYGNAVNIVFEAATFRHQLNMIPHQASQLTDSKSTEQGGRRKPERSELVEGLDRSIPIQSRAVV